jgi:uncharacterized radical SAM protein YgiQ
MGWNRPDIILVTGDTYIDSPHIGVAVIGRVLLDAGFRVAVIAQPDTQRKNDITRLGEPALFWGVTAGSVDAMIANRTATGKPRRRDDLTPGGRNTLRPDRATIVYANLIRRHFKNTAPVVLGGIEASLRRISHFDAWSDSVRRAILFDAKADYLLYGMAEKSVLELARALENKEDPCLIRGLCYISAQPPEEDDRFPEAGIELPAHDAVVEDKVQFTRMFSLFYANAEPRTAKRLYQKQDTRYLVHNPPQPPLTQAELDAVYELPYAHEVHPYYARMGHAPALETIRFSMTTHRGCFGECRFCAIAVHQGRQVVPRSRSSLVREATALAAHPRFKGVLSNVGGPTANMFAMSCDRIAAKGACAHKGCLFPAPCRFLNVDHGPQVELLRALRGIPGILKVFVGSGLRYDLIVADRRNGQRYLEEIIKHHASGQLKIAPEHVAGHVLSIMGKPGSDILERFLDMFEQTRRKSRKEIFLTYYIMAAHPGCTLADMQALRKFSLKRLKILPEQVQIFTPSPSTYATLMYYTGKNPFNGSPIFVEKKIKCKQHQKAVITGNKQQPKGKMPCITKR